MAIPATPEAAMTPRTYKAKIKLKGGGTQEVTIETNDIFNAKSPLEMQYGKGCIWSGPSEVKTR